MIYLSIDVEASGPFPGTHSLVSIGAAPVVRVDTRWCVDHARSFYVELHALDGADEIPEATAVHGLTREHLLEHGLAPAEAMARMRTYLAALDAPFKSAAWPVSFDHPFVGWYFQRFLGENPLGHSGFDIASYAMGLFGETSRNATFRAMKAAGYVAPENPQPHHALHDAVEQGQTLAWLLQYAEERRLPR